VQTIEATYDIIRRRMLELGEGPDVFGLIHADLHPFNILKYKEELRPIDFDDCGLNHFLYDLAVPLVMIEKRPDYSNMRTALLAGYRRFRTLDETQEKDLEVFMAARRLSDLEWLIEQMSHPEKKARFERWIPDCMAALGAFTRSEFSH
jgi:Ser/Thr protein kinase RdoA (MazF antagonist)